MWHSVIHVPVVDNDSRLGLRHRAQNENTFHVNATTDRCPEAQHVRRFSGKLGVAMSWSERITIDSGVLAGKPVVRGTRLAVDLVIGLLAQG